MRLFSSEERISRQIEEEGVGDGTVHMKSRAPLNIALTTMTFITGILIVLIIWTITAWYVNEYISVVMKFPYPWDSIIWVWDSFTTQKIVNGHTMMEHTLASLKRVFIAFIASAMVGVTLGVILGYFNRIYSVGIIPVTVFQTIPGLAWLPIALLLFGLGDDAAIFIIFSVSTMVITINVSGGIRTMPPVVTRAAGMMGANGIIMFFKILVPYSAVTIINGLRLGMGSAWRVLIAAEMLIATGLGLGSTMEFMRENFPDNIAAFGCIVVIVIIGLIIDKVIFSSIEKMVRHKLGMEEGF